MAQREFTVRTEKAGLTAETMICWAIHRHVLGLVLGSIPKTMRKYIEYSSSNRISTRTYFIDIDFSSDLSLSVLNS